MLKKMMRCLAVGVFAFTVTSIVAAPFVYVANTKSNTVSKIDAATKTVVATIDIGQAGPEAVTIVNGGKIVYVTNPNFDGPPGTTVVPIDGETNIAGQPITVGLGPAFAAIAPVCGANILYVPTLGTVNVFPIDITTNQVGVGIDVLSSSFAIAVPRDGKVAYVTLPNNHAVARIDTVTNMMVGTPTDLGTIAPLGIVLTPDGRFAYIVNQGTHNVARLDVVTNAVTLIPLPVGSDPSLLAITPDGKKVYVSGESSDEVYIIDTVTNTVVATIPIMHPVGIAVDDTGKMVYVVAQDTNSVVVINVATNTIVGEIGVGQEPNGLAITPLFTATATIKPNIFLDHTELIGVITWTAAPSDVAYYRIYQGDRIVGCVRGSEDPLQFFVPLASNTLPQFSITAVAADGSESRHILVCA